MNFIYPYNGLYDTLWIRISWDMLKPVINGERDFWPTSKIMANRLTIDRFQHLQHLPQFYFCKIEFRQQPLRLEESFLRKILIESFVQIQFTTIESSSAIQFHFLLSNWHDGKKLWKNFISDNSLDIQGYKYHEIIVLCLKNINARLIPWLTEIDASESLGRRSLLLMEYTIVTYSAFLTIYVTQFSCNLLEAVLLICKNDDTRSVSNEKTQF